MAWDQDPVRSPARPKPGAPLCAAADLPPGAVKRFVYRDGEHSFRALLVHSQWGIRGYVDWCSHQGIPLQDDRDDIIVQEGLLVCAWHFARYSAETGLGVDGPCVGGLPVWEILVGEDGVVRTA
jgi:nitrite reductase/ring-hydroxylating ferredoxin subunit